MRSLRVALVHPWSWPGVRRGGERYLHDLAWWLRGRGHRVTVVTSTRWPPAVERGDDGVRTIRVPRAYHRVLRRLPVTPTHTFGLGAAAALALDRHDVVHALVPAAALAGRVTAHPTVFTALGHPTLEDFALVPGSLPLFRAAVRRATAVTALSGSAAAAVEAVAGRRPAVLAPGVRLDVFTPRLAPRVGPPRVLFASDLSEPRKGLDVTFLAFARLLERRPEARLVLAGPGDHRWALPRLGNDAARVSAATDVVGPGELDDLPERYRAATVAVLPSVHEAFGLVLVEALASGTPVVTTAGGGMVEIVDSAVGHVVPVGDATALAAALDDAIDLAARPETPARCAEHARRWGWSEAVGPAHEDLYLSVARSPARG